MQNDAWHQMEIADAEALLGKLDEVTRKEVERRHGFDILTRNIYGSGSRERDLMAGIAAMAIIKELKKPSP